MCCIEHSVFVKIFLSTILGLFSHFSHLLQVQYDEELEALTEVVNLIPIGEHCYVNNEQASRMLHFFFYCLHFVSNTHTHTHTHIHTYTHPQVSEARRLRQGNVVQLGHSSIFRFNHPVEAQRMRQQMQEGCVVIHTRSHSSHFLISYFSYTHTHTHTHTHTSTTAACHQ